MPPYLEAIPAANINNVGFILLFDCKIKPICARKQNPNFVQMTNDIFLQHLIDHNMKKSNLFVSMLRLDKLHDVVSGNKVFKLKYYLYDAIQQGKKDIITQGGPFSNHLVAAAYAAKEAGLGSIGLVRGVQPNVFSDTLNDCVQYGMKLKFIGKNMYDQIDASFIEKKFPEAAFIPQGGYGANGVKGASEILNFEQAAAFDYIIAACGTGTMGAGLVNASSSNQKIILISVLKNNFSISDDIRYLLDEESLTKNNLSINFDFHLGGYAKKNKLLFQTMNKFYQNHGIETDFVYTGKMIFAFNQLVENGYFLEGSKILLIHSGGLQGNRSLRNGELCYGNISKSKNAI